MSKGQNYGKKQRRLSLVETCFYQKILKCSYQIIGQHTLVRQKVVKFGYYDNREYIDMSVMGVGTNILGYGHSEIDESVQNNQEWKYEHFKLCRRSFFS